MCFLINYFCVFFVDCLLFVHFSYVPCVVFVNGLMADTTLIIKNLIEFKIIIIFITILYSSVN